ncbi:MAG TPA: Trx7/PDZ domain-containing (seleno)protein [Planctomycetota bacterium]|nr:Trx7/PDZ domain-containing (seleno)protein [Planctomycetota bacterium]
MDCRGFDEQVARQDSELHELQREFVCVRFVKMNGVDLDRFRFDYDLTWAGIFLNADGTVYGRYGSRTVEDPMINNSAAGLRATMRRVVEAHRAYRPDEAGRRPYKEKRGPPLPFSRPEEFPLLASRREVKSVTRQSCIHCHNVHEAIHDRERSLEGRPRSVYKYPLPESIGLVIDPDSGQRVAEVLAGSPAARAGLERGDEVLGLKGQAVFSIADLQFVLEHVPDETELEVELRRGDGRVKRKLSLSGPWRRTDFTWRTSLVGYPPSPEFYFRILEPEEREKAGVKAGALALAVEQLFDEAKGSGLRVGDVILSVDGRREKMSGPGFRDYLRVHHLLERSPVRLEVLREGKVEAVEARF